MFSESKNTLFGIPIVSAHLPKRLVRVQTKYPCSKCRRIRKKWAKKFSKWIEDPNEYAYLIDRKCLDLQMQTFINFESRLLKDKNAFEARYLGYWSGIDSLTGVKFP